MPPRVEMFQDGHVPGVSCILGYMGPIAWLAGGIWWQPAVLKIFLLVKTFATKHIHAPVMLCQN